MYFVEWAVRRPWAVVIVTLLTVVVFGAGLLGLGLSSDTRAYFSATNEYLLELEDFEKKYEHNNNVLFVIAAPGGKVTTPEGLRAVAELTERAWQLPFSTRVDSLTNFPYVTSEGDTFIVRELVDDPEGFSEADAARVEEIAAADPLIVNRLMEPDGGAAGVNVNFKLPKEASAEVRRIIAATRALAAEIEAAYPGLKVRATGNVMLMGAFMEASLNDVQLLVPISLMASGLMLFIFLRSPTALLATVTLLNISALVAMGAAGWVGHAVNPSTVAAPVIIMTIAMASSVHVVISILQYRAEGMEKDKAIVQGLRVNAYPVALTSLTTGIGFLSLLAADSPPLNQMGALVAAGIFVNYLLTFSLLPAIMALLPFKGRLDRSGQQLQTLGRIAVKGRYLWVALIAAATVVLAQGLMNIRLDDDFIRYFDERFEYRRASDFAEQHLTGLNIVEFDLKAGSDGGVYDPAYQRKVAEFADWLRTQPKVLSVTDITQITRRIHKHINGVQASGGQEGAVPLPEDQELISQYFLIYELSLPYGAEITDRINVARSASRVTAILRGATSGEIRELNGNAQDWLAAEAPDHMWTRGTSINVIFSYLSGINVRAMLVSTAVSILVIGVIIAVALRSLRLGLISLVTNLFPAVIGFGVWGLTYRDIGLAGSVLTAMTIGIVVDDTIHFLSKYRWARRQGKTPEEAINIVFGTVGVAMFVTTTALVVGFSILALSGFEVNWQLGMQATIVVIAALAIDWFLVPALLLFGDKQGGPSEPT